VKRAAKVSHHPAALSNPERFTHRSQTMPILETLPDFDYDCINPFALTEDNLLAIMASDSYIDWANRHARETTLAQIAADELRAELERMDG
jgi:hypothetical protein